MSLLSNVPPEPDLYLLWDIVSKAAFLACSLVPLTRTLPPEPFLAATTVISLFLIFVPGSNDTE